MIGVAGIRGIVGETLTAEDFLSYALGFGTVIGGGRVVVGRDTRPSGEMVAALVVGGLLSTGCEVVDLGIVPTPTIGLMVRELDARGGVAITASHNPVEWNALKFFRADGRLQQAHDQAEVFEVCRTGGFRRVRIETPARALPFPTAAATHIARVVENVNAQAIRRRRFRVALDCCNGAGTTVLPGLLEALGCETTLLFDDMDKPFERVAEPLPENLGALSNKVRDAGADIGFAVDPDADRLAMVDEQGRAMGEERTVTLAGYHVLGRTPSPFVVNLSTTRAADDVAALRGVPLYRTAIGEAYVVEAMVEQGSAIGGEGNGGVIWPVVTWGRDSVAGIGLILDALAESGEAISAYNRRVPDYVMMKTKMPVVGGQLAAAFARLEERYGRMGRIWREDGLRIDLPEAWFHLRPSNTEPIVRLFIEAQSKDEAERLASQVMKLL
jgi:phosphomannomutase